MRKERLGVDGALATWPKLLTGRTEQRQVEPDVARARDLAEPVPLIRRLATEARELGGDPILLKPRSHCMRVALDLDSFANSQGEERK